MNDQNKIIIDENLQNTFETLNNNPSLFRIKDYARNLPIDYAEDFAYAFFEACLTFDAKYTLTDLVLGICSDEKAGTTIENDRFNSLLTLAKEANPKSKNGYLPIFFAYIQLIAEEPGLTEEENRVLISKIINIIKQDKSGLFPEKLYKKEEFDNSIGLSTPIPAQSFLAELKEFYENLITDPIAESAFDQHLIDSTLNQYIDDIYSLTYTEEDKNLSWFERTDKILTIQRNDSEDKRAEIIGISSKNDVKDLYDSILQGMIKYPLYNDGKYDFSYFSSAANLIYENIDVFMTAYNFAEKKESIDFPIMDLSHEKQIEFLEASRVFVASYMTALISEKYNLENTENDPDRLLDPNLKINLLKSNDKIFEIANSSGKTDEETATVIRELISISTKLVGFLENENTIELNPQFDIRTIQTKNEENEKTPISIQYKDIAAHLLNLLQKQDRVYADVIKNLYKIKGHIESGKHYKKDENMFKEYANLYAPNHNFEIDNIQELIDVIDRKADKFKLSLISLKERNALDKLVNYIVVYNSKNIPEPVKKQELKDMDAFVEKLLTQNRCGDKENVNRVLSILHEALTNTPQIRQVAEKLILDYNFSKLKTNQGYKKALSFSSVIENTLYIDKTNNQTTYRLVEDILSKKLLNTQEKFIIKDYIKDAIIDLGEMIGDKELVEIGKRFDETNPDSYIVDGFISNQNKNKVIRELRTIYNKLPQNVKQYKPYARLVNLVTTISDSIRKLPTAKINYVKSFEDFILDFVEDDEKDLLKAEISKDIKKIVGDNENDPYKLKEKYKKYIPTEEQKTFEDLWEKLPKTSAKTRDKNIFKAALIKIMKGYDKEEKIKYLTYFKHLFTEVASNFVAQDEKEKEEIEKYLESIKQELANLIEKESKKLGSPEEVNILLNILEEYANTTVDFEQNNLTDDEENN